MSKVAVVAFYWGDWPEDDPSLGIPYVNRLHRDARAHATVPFDFVLITEQSKLGGVSAGIDACPEMILTLPPAYLTYPWNFPKLFMFDPTCPLQEYEWVVALDLDLDIRGSIDFLLAHRSRSLVTCRGAYTMAPGGSVVGFDPKGKAPACLFQHLQDNLEWLKMKTGGSERKFYSNALSCGAIGAIRFWQYYYPGRITSYKVDGPDPPGASIVRFHGRPRPHEVLGWR